MGTVFTATRIGSKGENKPYSGLSITESVVLSCVGPSTSVNTGMAINVKSWLPTRCVGARQLGRKGVVDSDIEFYFKPATTWTTAAPVIVALRRSTGAALSSGVNLTSQRLIWEFIGA